MLKPPPAFTNDDDWFDWLAKHLAGRDWASNAMQFYMRQFFHGYTSAEASPDLPTFLASKLDVLPDTVVDRLYAYAEAFGPFVSQSQSGSAQSLFDALRARCARALQFELLETHKSNALGAVVGVSRDQLLLSIALWVGRGARSVETLQRQLGSDVELDVERWSILAGSTPAYELWTVAKLTGVVCSAGTATPVLELRTGQYAGRPRALAEQLAAASAFFALKNFAA